jgi:hypothetical protein
LFTVERLKRNADGDPSPESSYIFRYFEHNELASASCHMLIRTGSFGSFTDRGLIIIERARRLKVLWDEAGAQVRVELHFVPEGERSLVLLFGEPLSARIHRDVQQEPANHR